MARPCSVCRHPSAGVIDEQLRAGGRATRVAAAFGLSEDAVQRHRSHHLASRRFASANPAPVPNGVRIADSAPPVHPPDSGGCLPLAADALDELVDALRGRALAGDPAVVREYRLALAAATARAIATTPTIDYVATAEWSGLRARILAALEPYPDARLALADALA